MFVSTALKPEALTILNNYHQLYNVCMTYSENAEHFLPNSFLMRLFDQIGSNDFGNTNREYFSLSGQEKLFAVSMFELSAAFMKKHPF